MTIARARSSGIVSLLPARARTAFSVAPTAVLAVGCILPMVATALEPPTGQVLLIVDGNIERTNVGDEAHLDRAMLEAIDRHAFATKTPWSNGPQHFEGARLSALLDTVGAQSTAFLAVAIDDYSIEFENVDLERYPVTVTFLHNGEPMTVRELGPLRIVFPFDDYPELRTHTNEAFAVWQLTRMTVR